MNGRDGVDSDKLKWQILAATLEDIFQQREVVAAEAQTISRRHQLRNE